MSNGTVGADRDALGELVSNTAWYQTIELPGGLRTLGEFDLQGSLRNVQLPAALHGKRCLDIGTRDGFWAFEMERRGGDVTAIDIDDPLALDLPWLPEGLRAQHAADERANKSKGFDIVHRALDSQVDYRSLSVYDLSEQEVGTFDFAVLGTMLLHLRDPIGALAATRRVVRGKLLLNEVVSVTLSLLRPRSAAATLQQSDLPFWWIPNLAALRYYVHAAGYRIVDGPHLHLLKVDSRRPRGSWRARGHLTPLEFLIFRATGAVPHAWMLVEPRE